jgi:hypothetical protein
MIDPDTEYKYNIMFSISLAIMIVLFIALIQNPYKIIVIDNLK